MSEEGNEESDMRWLPQPSTDCPFLKDPPPSALEVLEHDQLFCDYCCKTRIHQLTSGEDVIFKGIPPWKKRKVEELQQMAQEPPQLSAKKLRKERKQKEPVHLPDGLAIKSYVNQGLSKEEAVEKLVKEKREKAKDVKKEADSQKEKTEFNEMPYVPLVPFKDKTSVFSEPADHQRYVAIASNFLQAIPKFRFEINKAELKSMDQKLLKERQEFQGLVLRRLDSRRGNPYHFANFGASRFVLGRINRRRMRLKGIFGNSVAVEVPTESDDLRELTLNMKRLLHPGKLRRIVIPNEKRKFQFASNPEVVSERFPLDETDKCPISEDETALSLALENDVKFITGVSSMLAIMCSPMVIDSSQYLLPVEVKRVYNEYIGRPSNVCIIGKPVVDSLLNPISIWYRFVKHAVKCYLYPLEKVSAKSGGRQRAMQKKKEVTQEPLKVAELIQGSLSSDDEKVLVIESGKQKVDIGDDIKSPKKGKSGDEDDMVKPSTSDDVFGHIIKEMGFSEDVFAASASSSALDSKLLKNAGDIHRRYAIFSLDEESSSISTILVRSNNDGLDSEGNPVIISNKIEYAGDFGGERLTSQWLLREILKCKLKGVQNLLRFRIHHSQLYLLQKERAIENKILEKLENGKEMLLECNKRLKAVIQKLQTLDCGFYLLKFCDDSIELCSQVQDTERAVYDFGKPWSADITNKLPPVNNIFNGIDEHMVMVYHVVRKQIPAAFAHSFAGKGRGRKRFTSPPKDLSQMSKAARRRHARRVGRKKGEKQEGQMVMKDLDAPPDD